jgi:hypothetical protein
VIAEHISEEAKENIAKAARSAEDEALKYISDNPTCSLATLAIAMNWTLYTGEPNKRWATNVVKALISSKLIKETRAGRYKLTDAGAKALAGDDETIETEPKGRKARKGQTEELPLTPSDPQSHPAASRELPVA